MALRSVIFVILITGCITFGICDKQKDYSLSYAEAAAASDDNFHLEYSAIFANSGNSQKIKRDTTRESLCDDFRCNCTLENSFFTVVYCDFNENKDYILNSRKQIPPTTTSLIIKLGPTSRLRIDENFFKNNKVNRILIKGNNSSYPTRKEHIEIRSHSFDGNLAPFPEIEITNCHTLILRENVIAGECKLNVTNCHEVIVFPTAFFNTSVYAYFNDIEDLRIQEKAFYNSKANIEIVRAKIANLYRFEAPMRKIYFYNCEIGNVTAGTFDVLDIDTIIFDHCQIGAFNTKAITEKLLSKQLKITGGTVGLIENEAFDGSGITEVILSNNIIDTIQSKAIFVTAIDILITKNRIIRTGEDWLRVKEWTNVVISNNSFGDFNSMQLDRAKNPKQCIFIRNSITRPSTGSLNITNPHCMIRETVFHHYCSCNSSWVHDLSTRDITSESYCRVPDNLKFCFNSSSFNVLKFKKEICDLAAERFDCAKSRGLKFIDGNFVEPEDIDGGPSYSLLYIIIGSCLLFIVILVVIITTYKCSRRKNTVADGINLPSEGAVLTDGDYETIYGTLENIRKKYPEIYEDVNKYTEKLINRNTTEMECVQLVGNILVLLRTLPDSGDDFVAFTAILSRYLKPNEQNEHNDRNEQNEPIYAEVNQTELDNNYELCGQRRPLLTNEYARPADRNDNVDPFYSEPVNNGRENYISPYATFTPNNNLNLNNTIKPSTSQLPDVLPPSNSTNVKRIVENYTKNLNTPEYTIPNKKKSTNIKETSHASSSPSSSDSRSNHSGGSDITVKLDDIDYADA